jgi:methyl-accepting chemotaxis protein
MPFLQNAKIRTKILSLIGATSLIGIAGVGYLSYSYWQADRIYADFIDTDAVAAVMISRANVAMLATGYSSYQAMAYPAASTEMQAIIRQFDRDKKQIPERLAAAKVLIPEHAASLDAFIADANVILFDLQRAVDLGGRDQNEEAKAQLTATDLKIKAFRDNIRTFIDDFQKNLDARANQLSDNAHNEIFTSLGALAMLFLGGLALALVVSSRSITRPIGDLRQRMLTLADGKTEDAIVGLGRKDEVGEMAAAVAVFRDNAIERLRLEAETEVNRSLSERERMEREQQKAQEGAEIEFAVVELRNGLERLASGDVAHRLSKSFAPHLDGLRQNFNTSMDTLQETLQAVGNNASSIDAGAREMRSSADDLAKRTEQQAASVEETAAALEQITTTVKDSARRAEEMGALVAKARHGAELSGTVVQQAVQAMHQIEQSSAEITNIIGVIDEIAFQTNLLALNAGVEAARAGDAGKGFAVVAQEVRELAQRSAQAAKEIKTLIGTSGELVRNGVKLVSETGTALNTIVVDVQQINGNVAAIVEAAREQSIGLQEINTAVNSMDQGTQQNAAMVEQATAATHTLSRDAGALTQLLSQFNLGRKNIGSQPASVTRDAQPAPSPARALGRRIASAFTGSSSAAVATRNDWEEF